MLCLIFKFSMFCFCIMWCAFLSFLCSFVMEVFIYFRLRIWNAASVSFASLDQSIVTKGNCVLLFFITFSCCYNPFNIAYLVQSFSFPHIVICPYVICRFLWILVQLWEGNRKSRETLSWNDIIVPFWENEKGVYILCFMYNITGSNKQLYLTSPLLCNFIEIWIEVMK